MFTTYSKLALDVKLPTSILRTTHWHRIVLDESQTIKNGCKPVSKKNKRSVFHALMRLHAHHRWAMSGSPVETSLEDWLSHFQFLRAAPYNDPVWFRLNFTLANDAAVLAVGALCCPAPPPSRPPARPPPLLPHTQPVQPPP